MNTTVTVPDFNRTGDGQIIRQAFCPDDPGLTQSQTTSSNFNNQIWYGILALQSSYLWLDYEHTMLVPDLLSEEPAVYNLGLDQASFGEG